MERTCKNCQKTKPIDQFQKHDSGWRHVCRDCRRLQHAKWQYGLEGKQLKKFDRDRDKSVKRYLKRQKELRAAKHRERHDLLRQVVTSMYRDGMTQKRLAKAAGITANTLRRIESEGPLEMGITLPIEEKLLDFYGKWRARMKAIERQREEWGEL